MKLLHSKLTDCKVEKSNLFNKVQYFSGVYFATIRDHKVDKVKFKELAQALCDLYPALDGRHFHYILTQELFIIVDRKDYGLMSHIAESTANKCPVQLIVPSACGRAVSPYILSDTCNEFTPDLKDKYTEVSIAKHCGKINYTNWSITYEPVSEGLVLVIDNQVMLECSKPIRLKELNDDITKEDEA